MDSFEWNKIIGSVLASLLFIVAVHIASQGIYSAPAPAKPAYVVPGVVAAAAPGQTTATATAAEPVPDFSTAIPMANAMNGAAIAERCAACHDWTKGGPNKIGPNLYGVVDRPRASHPGFDYSPAMKAKGGTWSYSDLFAFLKQPQLFVPGTKMTFGGLPKAQDRLDVIAFLRMQADSPAPLPPPGPAVASGNAGAQKGAGPAAAPGAGGAATPAAATGAPNAARNSAR